MLRTCCHGRTRQRIQVASDNRYPGRAALEEEEEVESVVFVVVVVVVVVVVGIIIVFLILYNIYSMEKKISIINQALLHPLRRTCVLCYYVSVHNVSNERVSY